MQDIRSGEARDHTLPMSTKGTEYNYSQERAMKKSHSILHRCLPDASFRLPGCVLLLSQIVYRNNNAQLLEAEKRGIDSGQYGTRFTTCSPPAVNVTHCRNPLWRKTLILKMLIRLTASRLSFAEDCFVFYYCLIVHKCITCLSDFLPYF